MARKLPDPRVRHGVSRRTLLAGAGMAMGQAAGAAAALAHRLGVTPAAVPLDVIRRTLQEHAAIVPEP